MSNQPARQARLHGWTGPEFPPGIELLQGLYGSGAHPPVDSTFLQSVGGRMPGYAGLTNRTTNDQYTWFFALEFWKGGRVVSIFLPWCQDAEFADDSRCDRLIAVYYKGEVPQADLQHVIREFTRHLTDALRERKETAAAEAAAKAKAKTCKAVA